MQTIAQVKSNLTSMSHSGTLNKVRNFEAMLERAANTMLLKCTPLETIRNVGLSQTVHDILFNYTLPSDYNAIIDLYPQANRTSRDQARRIMAQPFDLLRAFADKTVSIESSEGTKFIRIDWAIRNAKTLHGMDSLTGNGTWSASGTAANVVSDTIIKYSGGASVRFDLLATGDGIKNNSMSAIDLTDEDEIGTAIFPIYFGSVPTSATLVWGNNLTTNYWTGVEQTAQADGTAFKVGWNIIQVPWSTATETGTVAPATIDTARVTVASGAALADIRVDNIQFAIGFPFDIKYYSKFLFKNTSGTFISIPTLDDDVVILDNDGIQIYLLECLIATAHQTQGSDSVFDLKFAKGELETLYPAYKGEHPNMSKKVTANYGGLPKFSRFRR